MVKLELGLTLYYFLFLSSVSLLPLLAFCIIWNFSLSFLSVTFLAISLYIILLVVFGGVCRRWIIVSTGDFCSLPYNSFSTLSRLCSKFCFPVSYVFFKILRKKIIYLPHYYFFCSSFIPKYFLSVWRISLSISFIAILW